MGRISEKHLLYLFFFILICLHTFFLVAGESVYGFGGADNVGHYQIAKYAFTYPELFLDLWGKPVYTALLAPFTLFGYKTAKAFNLILVVVTLIFSAKIANRLYPGSRLFTVVLIAFAPVYFLLTTSCLTEVLFSLVLVLAVYLFINGRYSFSAAVLSFIPFVRSEGVILLPLFALALVLQRSTRSIVFLALGTAFYSLFGYFVFEDFLWFLRQQPYSLGDSIYGSGELFHFVKKSDFIFGIPLLFLIVTGLFYWFFEVGKKFSFRSKNTILFLVVAGSWITYFAAHSYVWWKGTGGSLGLTRVIGGVIPLAAFTAMKTFEFVSAKIKNKTAVYTLFSFFAVLQIVFMFTRHPLPLKAEPTEQLIKKSADYIRNNRYDEKIYYFNPLLIHFLGIDPYDGTKCNWWVADKQQPSNSMNWGDILVWDAHFGPNEGGVQLETLEHDPYLQEIKMFLPVEKITVLGGYNYSVHLFQKVKQKKGETVKTTEKITREILFGDLPNAKQENNGTEKYALLDSGTEFSESIVIYTGEMVLKDVLSCTIRLEYKSFEPLAEDEALLVFSVEESDGKNLRYETVQLTTTGENWNLVELNTRLPASLPESSKMLIYVWNKDRKKIGLKKITVNAESF